MWRDTIKKVSASRVIFHVDMDAFFASIAQLDNPALRGKAVLVGGTGPRAVVTTASYEARKFGCRSAMPMAVARRQCSHAIVTQVPSQRIGEMSHRLFEVLEGVAPLVQPLSVDEAFLDLTGTDRLLGEPIDVARNLKQRIRDELHLTASIGVAPNKFLAKLASDLEKPDGLTVIDQTNRDRILLPLPVSRIFGVGPATETRLREMGLHTIADLRNAGEPMLRRVLGDLGAHLFKLAHGIDPRPVVPDRQAKSIGQERTFDQDLPDPDQLRPILRAQADQVAYRLRKHRLLARGITVKIRFGDFQTITRSAALDRPSDLTDDVRRAAVDLFHRWASARFQPVRLIGVAATGLTDQPAQMDLFADADRQRHASLDKALDRITDRFGRDAVSRGMGDKPQS